MTLAMTRVADVTISFQCCWCDADAVHLPLPNDPACTVHLVTWFADELAS